MSKTIVCVLDNNNNNYYYSHWSWQWPCPCCTSASHGLLRYSSIATHLLFLKHWLCKATVLLANWQEEHTLSTAPLPGSYPLIKVEPLFFMLSFNTYTPLLRIPYLSNHSHHFEWRSIIHHLKTCCFLSKSGQCISPLRGFLSNI